METFVPEDSPLAAYLNGQDDAHPSDGDDPLASAHGPDTDPLPSFAPRGLPSMLSRIPHTPIYRSSHDKPLARVREWYGYLVASTLGSADNVRFLEHFRYILIASQLLNDQIVPASFRGETIHTTSHTQYTTAAASLVGALLSATLAFGLVWALSWSRVDTQKVFSESRLVLVLSLFFVAAVLLYGYIRRQWLQHLRRQAIDVGSDFVASAQGFEAITVSTFGLIQEVELISRGYRLSTPLPPVSRMDGSGQSRRCVRLRRKLRMAYSTTIPIFKGATQSLRPHVDDDDLERFLDAYDVRQEDVREAMVDLKTECEEDEETLRYLRGQQARLSTLRRLVLCSLLSIPATGRQADAVRWRACVQEMEKIRSILSDTSEKIAKLLHNDEDQVSNYTNTPKFPTHARNHSTPISTTTHPTSRRISTLSTGIRSIQAKLLLLREDSTRALSTSHSEPDLLLVSAALRDQYDAIGSDLRVLMHAWETGRQALVDDITKQERRVSRASSSLRSSLPSLGGLTAVEEDEDGNVPGSMSPRSSALRKLTGGEVTPPVTESEDEEDVFEAVAAPANLPRQSSALSREQRIARMVEERERLAGLREKREVGVNMIRELQAVIHLRPSHRRNTVIGNMGGGGFGSVP